MTNEELKILIDELIADAAFEEGEWLAVQVDVAVFKAFAEQLKHVEALQFDFLFCVTCIDWKSHLTMVYHLESTVHRHNLVVKVKLDVANPAIDTVCDTWQTANFHEREVYELFGIDFIGHPDLRLLILPDGWEGKNPLWKDFEDPINMIKL